MNFTLNNEGAINFNTYIDADGDISIKANGVHLGYINGADGKLHLFMLDEHERAKVTGLSLSNGKLTVA
jgi:hypothetical protein